MTDTVSLFKTQCSQPAGSAQQVWLAGPAAPVIWPNELHVWRVRLDLPWSWTLDEALSLEDRLRADRFRFESDRRKFCVARASLRLILGKYLKTKPHLLEIENGDYGKPYFADRKGTQGLRFNLSHSHELALIAIARDREVGVDLEYVRPNFATDEVASHFFSTAEAEELRGLPFAQKTESFFRCWTRKEAYIKGRGEGLYCALDQFDVSLAPGAPAALLDSRIDPEEVTRWSFQDLFPQPGYAGVVAVERGFSQLSLWDLV